jgi:hypothetical protein
MLIVRVPRGSFAVVAVVCGLLFACGSPADTGASIDVLEPDVGPPPECDSTNALTACDDQNLCTLESCVAGVCVNDPREMACDDGELCTVDDQCVAGVCQGGDPMDCNDENPCTSNSCHPEAGCLSSPLDGDPCDDGSVCTIGDVCSVGSCNGGPEVLECDDADPCTDDTCHAIDGCVNGPNTGADCDDDNVCTLGDVCLDGECTAGVEPLVCDDENACTEDSCEADDGCWNELTVSNACIPNIQVAFPPRAASLIKNDADEVTITITGSVSSGAGPIESLILNGEEVDVAEDGSFAAALTPVVGGNTFELVATDSFNTTTNRVQAFHWSNNYLFPEDKTVYSPESKCFESEFETGCFHVMQEPITNAISWTAAEAACVAWGGHLTSIHSDEENVFVQELAQEKCDKPSLWIGLSDHETEGTFVWSDGSAVDTEKWNPGEPNNAGGNEDFAEMKADGTWNDVGVNKAIGCFVCRKPYKEPDYLFSGHADPGAGLYMSQEAIDDGDHVMPADDLATIFEQVFAGFDVAGLLPSPAAEGVAAGGAVLDVYISNLTYNEPKVSLQSVVGGIDIEAVITGGQADLKAVKKSGPFYVPSTITGEIFLDTITITAQLELWVDEAHQLQVTIKESGVAIAGTDVEIDGWLQFIIEPIINGQIENFIGDIEEQFAGELEGVLGPMLVDALGALAFTFDFDLPSLNPEAAPVHVRVNTDFKKTLFDPNGGLFVLRTLATPDEVTVPYTSPGAPTRNNCGAEEQPLLVLEQSPMEIVLTDDTMNLILFAAWQGGFVEFDVPESLFGDVDLSAFNVTELTATVSGMLAPAISDCGPGGALEIHLGDLRMDASLKLADKPMDVTIYASIRAAFELTANEGSVGFGITDIIEVKTEINIVQDDMVPFGAVLGALIETQVIPTLLEKLSGDALGNIPLPSIDLGESLEGDIEAKITIKPLNIERVNGNTIIGAELDPGT